MFIFGTMGKCIIAVKRGKEELENPEWIERVQQISNAEILNNYRNKRILVSIDDEDLLRIKDELSLEDFHIEPVIEHKKSES